MKKILVKCLLFIALVGTNGVFAQDSRIDKFLQIIESGSYNAKIEMLERLQWSGISDPLLFDVVESHALEGSQKSTLSKTELKVVAYHIRALGYSGNEKYRATLMQISKESASSRIARYAKKALQDLDNFGPWIALINNSSVVVAGKSAEVEMYMRMLNVDNVMVQRLAARAIFHEQHDDQDLLNLTADKLKSVYLKEGLDRQAQDTAAWFCKAIGQSAKPEFTDFLTTVSKNTPYKNIRKHAVKFAT